MTLKLPTDTSFGGDVIMMGGGGSGSSSLQPMIARVIMAINAIPINCFLVFFFISETPLC
jgi:hypothetical protein